MANDDLWWIFDSSFDYLPSFFLAGKSATTGAGTEGAEACTGAVAGAETWTEALTGADDATTAGAAETFGGEGDFERLCSRCSLISADGFSMVSWIFFKILSNESWPE